MIVGHSLNGVSNDFPDIFLNYEVIKRVDKTKYLGIKIEEGLNWKEQYTHLKNKLGAWAPRESWKTFFLKLSLTKLGESLKWNPFLQATVSSFASQSSVCDTKLFQLNAYKQEQGSWLRMQNIRMDGWICKWLNVRSLIFFDKEVMTYKVWHNLCPRDLRDKFTKRSTISQY